MSAARGERGPLGLVSPLRGAALVRNSPADRVPSHGTTLGASTCAIDLVPLDDRGRTAPFTPMSFLLPEPPEHFAGFGLEVLAPADGTVRHVHDGEADHRAHRGLPSVLYALTQRRRLRRGWQGLAGNHVVLEVARGGRAAFVVLCHLQQGSIAVGIGQRVAAGEVLARCGNSGNSMEPHVHVQAMDGRDPGTSAALPLTFPGGVPRAGQRLAGAGEADGR